MSVKKLTWTVDVGIDYDPDAFAYEAINLVNETKMLTAEEAVNEIVECFIAKQDDLVFYSMPQDKKDTIKQETLACLGDTHILNIDDLLAYLKKGVLEGEAGLWSPALRNAVWTAVTCNLDYDGRDN